VDTLIDNPILNPPYDEPGRHFRFDEDGITSEVVEERRGSAYFLPIPSSRRRGKQLTLNEQTADRVHDNPMVNRIREEVRQWREGAYPGITPTTRALLEYWRRPDRERLFFFCQLEAVETAIYIREAAGKRGDAWIAQALADAAADHNPDLRRLAIKMATGTGKTVVMAMLIAWHTLNKHARPQDKRFTDAFLVVSPGITIRDRLRVLLPSDPGNYYRERDIVSPRAMEDLAKAKIVITNYHSFLPRETVKAARRTKQILAQGGDSAFVERADQVVRRVCRELGGKRNILVLNDEAHHCYRPRPGGAERLDRDERREADQRDESARVWIDGLDTVQRKLGIRAVYDLSATPFFLRGSGYPEGTLFPWVVADFSLIDAVEAGLVKIPRVTVDDNAAVGTQPTYRDLWNRIREDLPKKGRRGRASTRGEPEDLPKELQGALESLYGNYERAYERWEAQADSGDGSTPPVFIVVCNNTSVSKLVFDWIAGHERDLDDGRTVVAAGNLPLLSNASDGRWSDRPTTILVDSQQLESGEAMSAEVKRVAAMEIDEFKRELRERFPGRDADVISDEDLLREVMNTVGKPGRLGEHVRCVVSVSMLTEGWDANTVTHILGVRAFGTQLLCEQVVGRGLRRRSHVLDADGRFQPEYAEVYGVPFSFIPCSGSTAEPPPAPRTTRVRALPERSAAEIRFPRLAGYRTELADERLTARFTPESRLELTTRDVPTSTEVAAIVGEAEVHTLDRLREVRAQSIAFELAKRTLQRHFRDEGGRLRPWFFPQLVRIARRWLDECLVCADDTFPQLVLLVEIRERAADRIARALEDPTARDERVLPILKPFEPVGSTRWVDFHTAKPTYRTPEKCQVSHVALDSDWEAKLAQTLGAMDEVASYAKNDRLGFEIPYPIAGEQRRYVPDFLVRVDDGGGPDDLLNLIVEVSGAAREDKQVKVDTARRLWVPAVNRHGGFGRWAFVEVTDPWSAKETIRATLAREGAAA
jgi:type III restriction enzyme